jgi:hypothetical protein
LIRLTAAEQINDGLLGLGHRALSRETDMTMLQDQTRKLASRSEPNFDAAVEQAIAKACGKPNPKRGRLSSTSRGATPGHASIAKKVVVVGRLVNNPCRLVYGCDTMPIRDQKARPPLYAIGTGGRSIDHCVG